MHMKTAKAKEILQAILAPAGIVIDGNGDSDIRDHLDRDRFGKTLADLLT